MGKIGAALELSAPATPDVLGDFRWLTAPLDLRSIRTNSYTLSVWYRPRSRPADTAGWNQFQGVITHYGYHLGLVYEPGGRFIFWERGTSNVQYQVYSDTVYDTNAFHFAAYTVNCTAREIRGYVDGRQAALRANIAVPLHSLTSNTYQRWKIGMTDPWAGADMLSWPADGTVDEARLEAGVRSAEWLNACYRNQSNPFGFLECSRVEVQGHGLVVVIRGAPADIPPPRDRP